MISARDPATTAETDRLSELASVFAVGYLRLLLSRAKGLALGAQSPAPCERSVNTNEIVKEQAQR
jgi:hypothetical protein